MAAIRNAVILVVAALFLAIAVSAQDSKWVEDWVAANQANQTPDDGTVSTEATTKAAPRSSRTITVGPKGAKYKTITAAINSIPKNNKQRIIILIANAVYREKITIVASKPFIYFKCQSRKTVITYGDTAGKAGGTTASASTTVHSSNFIASDCTFANSAPAPAGGAVGKQAVAFLIDGDMGAFYRCGFYGAQDTLYDKLGRHYFRDCYIQGSIDFIFGNGQSWYQTCTLNSIAQGTSGSFTAQNRMTAGQTSGYVFYRCTLQGTGQIYLGRAWGTYSRVVFYQCYIANVVIPIGWFNWGIPAREKTVFYAEFQCSGPGSNRKQRAPWSKELTLAQARVFSSANTFVGANKWLEPAM